jgi:hypothetical protein
MQADRDEPVPPTKATLTVSALDAAPAATPIAGIAAGGSAGSTQDIAFNNRLAAFDGGVAGLPMGAARRQRASIRHGEQLTYEIDVPEGTAMLLARVADVADAKADLDVYVVDCTGKECRNPQTDSDPVGDEIVSVSNPAKGKWKVVVDALSVPAGSTTFAYLDAVFNPSFGAITTADVPVERKTGESWTARTHTWLAGPLPAGREPFPAVLLEGQLSGNVPFRLGILELTEARAAANSQQR